MLVWFAENWGTLLTGAIVLLVVAALVVSLVKSKRRAKSSGGCSGGCAGCSMCGSCHPVQTKK